LEALVSDVARPLPALAARVADVARQIASARVLLGAGRYEQAVSVAAAAVAMARPLGYDPVLAEALLVQGNARMRLAGRQDAVPLLLEATHLAISSRMDAVAVEAWARRAWAEGTSSEPAHALDGFDVVERLATRGHPASFAHALLLNNAGSVELSAGSRDRARGYLERALIEARAVTGPEALELIGIRENLAFVTDDHAQADQLLVRAAADLGEQLGAGHPDALDPQWMRGYVSIEDLGRVVEVLTPVCRAYDDHLALADRSAECWTEVGFVEEDLGHRALAVAALRRAVRTEDERSEARPYLALLQDGPRPATAMFGAALAALPARAGAPWWERLSRAKLTLGLGRARRAGGDLRGAREAFAEAIADLEPIVTAQRSLSDDRRLGRARVELALTLATMGLDSRASRQAAAAAAGWLTRVGGARAEIDRLASGGH
ncbi:MAG: hypothetical protein ABIY55_11890, partial [Kofleriaceae bacterium]